MISTLITKDAAKLAFIVKRGGVVIFPTETVYGIGADSTNETACLRIYEIKNRPLDNPLISHFESIKQIATYCELDDVAKFLLETFSPGPLTLVLPKKKSPYIFTMGLDTLAVRIPDHTDALTLIREAGVPISAPSANVSGRPSLTREVDVIETFDGKVDGILQGQAPIVGIESTVLDVSGPIPTLLRPGKVTVADLLGIIPNLIYANETVNIVSESDLDRIVRSPGMKYRHYSPLAKVVVLEAKEFINEFTKHQNDTKVSFIGFDFVARNQNDISLQDNIEYMNKLYSYFVDSDKNQIDVCFCQTPIDDSYRIALLNRLHKAESKK